MWVRDKRDGPLRDWQASQTGISARDFFANQMPARGRALLPNEVSW